MVGDDMVAELRLRQPAVMQVAIQPIDDWTRIFEPFGRNQLLRTKERAEGPKGPANASHRRKFDAGEDQ